MTDHTCQADGCERRVRPNLLMCHTHWRLVPANLRHAVWEHYRPGQEEDLLPTDEYLAAARAAIRAVKDIEAARRPTPKPPAPGLFDHESGGA